MAADPGNIVQDDRSQWRIGVTGKLQRKPDCHSTFHNTSADMLDVTYEALRKPVKYSVELWALPGLRKPVAHKLNLASVLGLERFTTFTEGRDDLTTKYKITVEEVQDATNVLDDVDAS
jgi:hypothetical protein